MSDKTGHVLKPYKRRYKQGREMSDKKTQGKKVPLGNPFHFFKIKHKLNYISYLLLINLLLFLLLIRFLYLLIHRAEVNLVCGLVPLADDILIHVVDDAGFLGL